MRLYLDLGIDLGTVNTRISRRGTGIILAEPTMVARSAGRIVAVGQAARQMAGRTPPGIEVIYPLKEGVIADAEAATALLTALVRRVRKGHRWQPLRLVLSTPLDVTDVERRALHETGHRLGARAVHLIEEPLAAAIGAGLAVAEAAGSLVVDIGAGTSEAAVIALGGFAAHQAVRIGGLHQDAAIVEYLRHQHQLLIGELTAEAVKLAVGSAWAGAEPAAEMTVRGRDLRGGLPLAVRVTAGEIREAIAEPVSRLVELVRSTLERTPPELAADVISQGVWLTGGGALLPGLDQLIQHSVGVPVCVAPDALNCVATGAAQVVEGVDRLRRPEPGRVARR